MAVPMSTKTPEYNSNVYFILIIPVAISLLILIKTWKLILSLVFLGSGWRVWQQYEWKKIASQIHPTFQNLVRANGGRLNVLELSLKANITSKVASRYLLDRAYEYGAQLHSFGDERDTYYFMTTGALRTILAESEPVSSAPRLPMPAIDYSQAPATPIADSSPESTPETPSPSKSVDYFPE